MLTSALFGISFEFMLGLVLFLIITCREILWTRVVYGNSSFNQLIAVVLAVYFLVFFLRVLLGKRRNDFPAIRSLKFPGVRTLVGLAFGMICFLLGSKLVRGGSPSAYRFIAYYFFFMTLLTSFVNIRKLAKFFTWATLMMSLCVLLQALLVGALHNNHLADFQVVPEQNVMGRNDAAYVNPYGLGLLRIEPAAKYGPFEIERANSYTTEPKGFSLIIWVGIACMFFAYGDPRILFVGLLVFGAALFISHAYMSIAILVVTAVVYQLGKLKKFSPLLLMLIGFGWLDLLIFLACSGWISLPGFSGERLETFRHGNLAGLVSIPWSQVGWFGLGFEYEIPRIPTLLQQYVRYGIIGMIPHCGILLFMVSFCFKYLREVSSRDRVVLSITFSIVAICQTLFSPEIVTPLYWFLYVLVIQAVVQSNLAKTVQGAPSAS